MNQLSPQPRVRPTTQAAEGVPRLRWTLAEFERLTELGVFTEDDRIELIGGELVPMSPDVFVKEGKATDSAVTDDALVIFEVLSRSDTKADQAWRRKVYASVPNCRHYITVSLKTVEVDAYDRDSGWKKRAVTTIADSLDLPALGLSIPLADIYRRTPLGPR